MRVLSRFGLAFCLLFGMAVMAKGVQSPREENNNKNNRNSIEAALVGTWEMESPQKGLKVAVEFTRDRRMILISTFDGIKVRKKSTYEVVPMRSNDNPKAQLRVSEAQIERSDGKKTTRTTERPAVDEIEINGNVLILKNGDQKVTFEKKTR